MTKLKIYLFGSPHIEWQGRFMDIRLRKALALLAYLAVTRQAHARDTLAALFWPEADQRTSRADLRRTVYNFFKESIGSNLRFRYLISLLRPMKRMGGIGRPSLLPVGDCRSIVCTNPPTAV